MSWYKSPIRPYDPVLEDAKDNESSRYYRDSFEGTGQDSRTNPPAQDASMWEALTNIMPITRGGLDRRWGYVDFASTGVTSPTRLFSFQRDTDGLRTIVAPGVLPFPAFNEDGSVYNPSVFTPTSPPRMVNSRSYGYFLSGNVSDLVKWDGSASGGTSNWGIAFENTIGTLHIGPSFAGIASAGSGWSNANGALAADTSYATVTTGTLSSSLHLSNFGFAIPADATIQGIVVELSFKADLVTGTNLYPAFGWVTLTKNGIPVGNTGQIGMTPNSFSIPTAFFTGGSTNLWNTSWTPNDLNNSNFGINIQGFNEIGGRTIKFTVDYARVSVFYSGSLSAITVSDGGSGGVDLTVGRIYYLVFNNSTTGHFSDLGPASGSTGPKTSRQISLSGIPVSSDPQVDQKVILATSDGGDPSILYQLAIIPNSQTTYTDNIAENTLVLNQVYLFTDDFGNDFGVAGNTPPPNGKICVKHKGRLWIAVGQNVYYSKSVGDLTLPNGFVAGKYEEAWPADNFLDISEGAETVSGMISSGQALFIGTQRHVRWITGDDPSNFSEPEIVHPEVGVLNQEVWHSVFLQGTPSGCIWLTPDFRVILSDFNSYQDIGHPIQDILDTINLDVATLAHAMFVNDGEFDLYILAIPTGSNTTCDTHLIYNMRSQKWVVWQPSNNSLAMLFNVTSTGIPQWLFSSSGNLFKYTEGVYDDNGLGIPCIARTSWLHLGAPTHRKLLDELEIVGDTDMSVIVEGATPVTEFTGADIHLLKNTTLTTSPFGQSKVYLATSGAKDRYYRLTFQSTRFTQPFLRSYSLKSIPFNTL